MRTQGSRHVLLGAATDYRLGCDQSRVLVYVNLKGHALKGMEPTRVDPTRPLDEIRVGTWIKGRVDYGLRVLVGLKC